MGHKLLYRRLLCGDNDRIFQWTSATSRQMQTLCSETQSGNPIWLSSPVRDSWPAAEGNGSFLHKFTRVPSSCKAWLGKHGEIW